MKKIKFLMLSLMVAIGLTSCYRVMPGAGEESVLIYQPMLFGHGGVDSVPITTGATWCVTTTRHVEYKITPFTYTESFKDMIPSDNTPVSFNAYLKLKIIKGKSPILHQNFGINWYVDNIQEAFRTMVRIHASKFPMFDLASKKETTIILQDTLLKEITAYIIKNKIPVEVCENGVIIGAVTPPEEVLSETKNTAAQNQSILTQNARKKAEDARKSAEESKALADLAYRDKFGMTTDQYLHLRQLEIEKEKVELIKDHDNVTVIFGGGIPTTYPVK